MNERQYQWLCDNRRAREAVGLGEVRVVRRGRRSHLTRDFLTPVVAVVAKAARQLRRRELAVGAWQQVAGSEWLAVTMVESVQQNTLVIAADSSTVCFELRRQGAALERALRKLLPGVSHIRFVVQGRELGEEKEANVRGGLEPRAGGPGG